MVEAIDIVLEGAFSDVIVLVLVSPVMVDVLEGGSPLNVEASSSSVSASDSLLLLGMTRPLMV